MGPRAGEVMLRREDGGVVCEHCMIADTLTRRMRGLIGRRDLPAGHGIVLRPGWSIHTAFMSFPIDVVFLDGDQVVLKVVPSLKPWRAATRRGARDVVELAAGECARHRLQAGDRVTWAARPANGERHEAAVLAPAGAAVDVGLRSKPDRPIRVVLGSRDDRFLRLARFLLTRKDFQVESTKRLPSAVHYVERRAADVVVLDASGSLGEAARTVAAVEALDPAVRVLIVSDDGSRPATGLHVLEKWQALQSLADEKLAQDGSRAWT